MGKIKLKFKKFDDKGIPLKEVIAVHRQFQQRNTIQKNLGDGFLYATNPVDKNIRDEFLRRKFSFTERNEANYFAFPLMALDELIQARRIPYLDNFSWLEKIERAAPNKFTLTELKRSELKFNYLFHESAHFIAHQAFFGRKASAARSLASNPKRASNPKPNQDSLLKIFLGEAFANTVEALSAPFAEGEIGSYFLDANTHFRSSEKESRSIFQAAKREGWEKVALALMGAFLYSNFLFEKLSRKQVDRIQRFSGIRSEIRPIVKIGLNLNEEFRESTTPLHLVKCGFPRDINSLMDFDPFEKMDEKNGLATKAVALELARVATKGMG